MKTTRYFEMRVIIALLLCVCLIQGSSSGKISIKKLHKNHEDIKIKQDNLVRHYSWGVPAPAPKKQFLEVYYRLLKYVASADGVFSDLEKGAFIFDASQSNATPEEIEAILNEDLTHYDAHAAYTKLHSEYPDLGKWLVYSSYLVAGADGLGEQEIEAVGKIAAAFHVSEIENHSLRYSFEIYYKGKEMSLYYIN